MTGNKKAALHVLHSELLSRVEINFWFRTTYLLTLLLIGRRFLLCNTRCLKKDDILLGLIVMFQSNEF